MKQISFLLVFIVYHVHGQSVTPTVIASDGGFYSSAQGSIEWTIGEPVSETYSAASNIATMGFHQPSLELATLIKEQTQEGRFLIYPNPVADILKIDFSGIESGTYKVRLNDVAGKLVLITDLRVTEGATEHQIRLEHLASGAYFLNVQKGEFEKTVKINKVN